MYNSLCNIYNSRYIKDSRIYYETWSVASPVWYGVGQGNATNSLHDYFTGMCDYASASKHTLKINEQNELTDNHGGNKTKQSI